MIVSTKYRYVFIQFPHTASTAVGDELTEHYDGESVMHKHAMYHDFAAWAGDEARDYFVFSSIRNPMDEVVSIYHKFKTDHRGNYSNPANWKRNGGWLSERGLKQFQFIQREEADFADYLDAFFRLPYVNWSILDHKNFDFVIRFEHLQEDFAEVLRRMNLSQVRPLPLVNKTQRMAPDYAAYFGPDVRDRAVWAFGPMMRYWDYDFPESWNASRVPWTSWVGFYAASLVRRLYWRHLA